VVGIRVDGIGSNGIDAKLLEDGNIPFASRLIGERVNIFVTARGVTPWASSCLLLIGDTLQEELVSALGEELRSLFTTIGVSYRMG
jgi:hypothetical protein